MPDARAAPPPEREDGASASAKRRRSEADEEEEQEEHREKKRVSSLPLPPLAEGEEEDSDDAPLASRCPPGFASLGSWPVASSGLRASSSPRDSAAAGSDSEDSEDSEDSDDSEAGSGAQSHSEAEASPVRVRVRPSPSPSPSAAAAAATATPRRETTAGAEEETQPRTQRRTEPQPQGQAAEAGQGQAQGQAQGGGQGRGQGQGQGAAASSDSGSDSGSSSEDSSSSDSEAEEALSKAAEAPEEAVVATAAVEDEETRRQRELRLLHTAQLRREELARMLLSLPEEEAENAILRSFVRITAAQSSCVLAEVSGLERSAAYPVPLKGDRGVDSRSLAVQLRCKRGSSTRLIKITSVSNQDATEAELEQWKKLSQRAGVEAEYYLEQMRQKAQAIREAREFVFTEAQVSRMMLARPHMEFDAQKESRMRFLVQCALSQMDISGIRDYESEELESRYREALKGLQLQEQRSAQVQEEWFEKRPNLFSLKMINQKNADRQIRDDRHALHYALRTEEGGGAALNPFQRRACRPVVAWDTKLTAVEGFGQGGSTEAAAPESAEALTPAAAASSAPESTPTEDSEPGLSRVDRVMRAHRRADLLSKLGSLVTPQAA